MKLAPITLLLCLAIFTCQCRKDCPVSGAYTSEMGGLAASVVDSTLYLIFSDTAMAYYQLQHNFETENYIVYSLIYDGGVTSFGFRKFPMNLDFLPNKYHGGMITLIYSKNNRSFDIGGYDFSFASDVECNLIYSRWNDLLYNNVESKIFK